MLKPANLPGRRNCLYRNIFRRRRRGRWRGLLQYFDDRYQEVLTTQLRGQIVTMTYTEIGNYA